MIEPFGQINLDQIFPSGFHWAVQLKTFVFFKPTDILAWILFLFKPSWGFMWSLPWSWELSLKSDPVWLKKLSKANVSARMKRQEIVFVEDALSAAPLHSRKLWLVQLLWTGARVTSSDTGLWVTTPVKKQNKPEQSTSEPCIISSTPTWQVAAWNMVTFQSVQLQVNIVRGHCPCLFQSCFNDLACRLTIFQESHKSLSWGLGSVLESSQDCPLTCPHGLMFPFPGPSVAWISISVKNTGFRSQLPPG